MKNIQFYYAEKYRSQTYELVSDCTFKHGERFVTSLCFLQEPDCGEGSFANIISQYPLEDLLDKFGVCVSDEYPLKNTATSKTCYLEFSARTEKSINDLLSIIGHRVINKTIIVDGKQHSDLIIE